MKILVNGVTIESEDSLVAITAAIQTFFTESIPPELETVRIWALSYLNIMRGEVRSAVGLTQTNFQELCYTGKALEAQRWLSAQNTDFGLAAEAQTRNVTNIEMANLVLTQWSVWQKASDQIESEFFTAKMRVENAETINDIIIVLSEFQKEIIWFYQKKFKDYGWPL